MATRIKEWMIPYTWWDGIEITDNHVINVLLRAANNLIHVNEDRELYVDLQLPAGIAPDDEFPVGVTTGEILAEDWWEQSGTIINSKTTSGDYVRLIYANDWNLYYDPWTWVWIMIGTATAIDVNTKTFFLTGTTWADNRATAQAAVDWYLAWKNPLLMYNNRCYILVNFRDTGVEGAWFNFESVWNNSYGVNGNQTINIETVQTQANPYKVAGISTGVKENNDAKTQTFYIRPWDTVNSRTDANVVLAWYKKWNVGNRARDQIYSPRLYTTDTLGASHIYELTSVLEENNGWLLQFVSQTILDEAPLEFYVASVILYFSGNTVTQIQRNDYRTDRKYTAGSWISIDSDNVISANIQWALVYKWNVADVASLPSSWNTVWDVYYVEADGVMYAWDGTAWKAVGNTQIDLSNYFNVTTNTTDDITQGNTNLFVTQAMIESWNWKQWALTAWTNIQINNWVISATDTTYSAGTGIAIDQNNQISNSYPFNPENAGSVWQVLKRTSTGARRANESWITIQWATFGSFLKACLANGTDHTTNIWIGNTYTFTWIGYITCGVVYWLTLEINGVTIFSQRSTAAAQWQHWMVWPITLWPWDVVTVTTVNSGDGHFEAHDFY